MTDVEIGTVKQVWHVVGPPTVGDKYGPWYAFDSEAEAVSQAALMERAQITEGTSTFSQLESGMTYWNTPRPPYTDSGNTTL